MTIGQRISNLRRQYSYSQEYVAEKLDVSRQAVSKWEQDQAAPDTYNLIALAQLFHVTVEYLAVGKIEEPAQDEKIQPVHGGKMPMQKIIGLILLGAGLLSLILGVLFSEELVILSLWLLWGGGACIAARRNRLLFIFWSGMALFSAMASARHKGWLLAFYYLQFPGFVNTAAAVSFLFWVGLIAGTVWTLWKALAAQKAQMAEKRENEKMDDCK